MSEKGILEELLAKVNSNHEMLVELLEIASNGQSVSPQTMSQIMEAGENPSAESLQQAEQIIAGSAEPTTPAATMTVVPPAETAAVELDEQGCPWDERINTNNHSKTQKGIFKKKPGLDAALYNQVVAELQAKYANTPVAAPAVSTAPATAPTVPAAPAAPATPSVPVPQATTPAAPTVPAAPAKEEINLKNEIAKQINEMTSVYGVPVKMINVEMLKKGADTIDAIPEEKYQELYDTFSEYLDGLEACQSVIDDIEALDIAHPGHNIAESIPQWIQSVSDPAGGQGNVNTFNELQKERLKPVAEVLRTSCLEAWKAYFAAPAA